MGQWENLYCRFVIKIANEVLFLRYDCIYCLDAVHLSGLRISLVSAWYTCVSLLGLDLIHFVKKL